jgi:hypothetical protein
VIPAECCSEVNVVGFVSGASKSFPGLNFISESQDNALSVVG